MNSQLGFFPRLTTDKGFDERSARIFVRGDPGNGDTPRNPLNVESELRTWCRKVQFHHFLIKLSERSGHLVVSRGFTPIPQQIQAAPEFGS